MDQEEGAAEEAGEMEQASEVVEEALAVAGVVVGVEDVEEEVVDLEVEADDMTMRKKLFYYLIHIVLTLYEVSI